ncbi:MAG: heavy metal translocating P-type ATPase [Thiotrichaceae bacterium]|nr:heavy metal translocating P-type ATPase [Thiotrichaceae bacterium]
MVFVTLTVLSCIGGGVYYAKKRTHKNTVKSQLNLKQKLSAITAHKRSLDTFTDESTAKKEDDKAIAAKRDFKLTRSVFLSSTSLAIAGSLFYPPLALLSIPTALYLTRNVFINTYKMITQGNPLSADAIMSIFVSSLLYQGYFIACHFFIFLYLLNRHLLKHIKDESSKNIIDIFRDQPRSAWVVIDDTEMMLPIEEVRQGGIVVVRAGDSIPIDGHIVKGFASIDQHLLTGESQPVEKKLGDTVFACTVVLTGHVYICVDKTGDQTASAQIGQILNQTVDFKTNRQLKAEQLTNKTILPTLGLGAASLVLFNPTTALIVINSHFRYRLTLATATSALTFLNLAAQRGILLKSGIILELMNEIDTVVFDKTGTLTLEIPHVSDVHTFGAWQADDVIRLAATAESRQSHPIAKAICNEAKKRELTLEEITDSNYQLGYGLVAVAGDKNIQVGSLRYAQQVGIEIPDALFEKEAACHQHGDSLVIISVNEQLAGAIELQASIRPEAEAVIQYFQNRGLSLHIISGDHPAPTKALAEKLHIDHYHAEILPKQKADIIQKLQNKGHSVCYIGDGINDAIALKQAKVSVSLRGASSVATDTAEVILMDQNLQHLCELFDLSEEYEKNVKITSLMVLAPSALNIGLIFAPHFGLMASLGLSGASVVASFGSAMLPLIQHQQISEDSSTLPLEHPDQNEHTG